MILWKSGGIWDLSSTAFQTVPLLKELQFLGITDLKIWGYSTHSLILYFWGLPSVKQCLLYSKSLCLVTWRLTPLFCFLLETCFQSFYLTLKLLISYGLFCFVFFWCKDSFWVKRKMYVLQCVHVEYEFKCCYASWRSSVSMVEAKSALLSVF